MLVNYNIFSLGFELSLFDETYSGGAKFLAINFGDLNSSFLKN
jgi:hypothetical protein